MATNPEEEAQTPYEGPVAYLVRGTKRVATTTSSNHHIIRAVALLVAAAAVALDVNVAVVYVALVVAALFNK